MDSASSKNEIFIKNSQLDCMRRTVEAQDSSAKLKHYVYIVYRAFNADTCKVSLVDLDMGIRGHKSLKSMSMKQKTGEFEKAADDATLMRFLRARDFNVQKASQFFLKYLKWRRAFVPLSYIPETEVCNELEKKKIFIQGLDKQGRPIGVILAARHNSNDRDLEEFKRLVVYGLDKICASSPRDQEKFTIIADLEGWGYKNTDIRAYLSALEILQNFYPERLGKLIMIHVPYIFWAAWKMVYPFIDKVTKQKIIFVEDKHLKETLLSDIEERQLPEIYGGRLPLVPAQDCIINNSSPVMLSNGDDGFKKQ